MSFEPDTLSTAPTPFSDHLSSSPFFDDSSDLHVLNGVCLWILFACYLSAADFETLLYSERHLKPNCLYWLDWMEKDEVISII